MPKASETGNRVKNKQLTYWLYQFDHVVFDLKQGAMLEFG